jgi:hypothetical protein
MNFNDDATSMLEDNSEMNKMFEMEWSKEHEGILVDWADKAMCYRWLHSQANQKFTALTRIFTIPVIIISTLTGTANFAQDRVAPSFLDTFVMIVGGLNLLAGIISTIQQFLKINELNEAHRVSSIAWDKFYRNIKIELAKQPKERIPVGQMLKLCKEEFDRLMETSPIINEEIIKKFKTTFKNMPAFDKIRKPEICDSLVSTVDFLYSQTDDKKKQGVAKMRLVAHKLKEMENAKKTIKDYIDQFRDSQDRSPTKDELYESINIHPAFKSIRRDFIETAIQNYFDSELNDLNREIMEANERNGVQPSNVVLMESPFKNNDST